METKQKIRDAALRLFAVKGYDAVSIRDIGAAVGIRESSIYHHYRNKQDILDHLYGDIRGVMDGMKERFMRRFEEVETVDEESFASVALHYLNAFFRDDGVGRFIRMLSIERQSSGEAEAMYRQLVFEMPVAHQTMVFERMIARGLFKRDDAGLLAQEYQGAVFSAYMRGAPDGEFAALMRRFYRRGMA